MKTKFIILGILSITSLTLALVIGPFRGWDWLENDSPDIVLVDCRKTFTPLDRRPENRNVFNGPRYDADIYVFSVLKGTTKVGFARMQSQHELQKEETYLIYANYDGGNYQAYPEYQVIPLGHPISIDSLLNSITNKPLNEQLQILFKRRIDNLNQEIQNDQVEIKRLEEGIKK